MNGDDKVSQIVMSGGGSTTRVERGLTLV